MIGKSYLTCFWPGLTELWWCGRLSALPYALAFTLIFNLYLISRFIYPMWLPPSVTGVIFWIGFPIWLLFIIRDLKILPEAMSPSLESQPADQFQSALSHTLKKEYPEAEGLLTDMLAIAPKDPPALLLLASLYRKTSRLDAANLLLREMRRLEVAESWWLEIEAEQQRIKDQMSREQDTVPDSKERGADKPDAA